MTIVEDAKKGLITEEMKIVAKDEGVTEDFIRRGIAEGHIVNQYEPVP
jgi:Thiamine biosynthesis protein ThiC